MQESFISSVVLPLAIFLIMVTMGMTLTVADFRRVFSQPLQVTVGLVCQMLLLPVLGFGVAYAFALEPIYAVSIVLLAAAPGGTTSNLIVHAAEGDRALSVTLTAISNSVVFLTMPFILSIGVGVFGGGVSGIEEFPVVSTMIQVAALSVVPVLIGMGIRSWKTDFAERSKDVTKILAAGFLFLVIFALVIQNWETIVRDGPRFAPAFIALNLLALLVGYVVARLMRINHVQSSTISIETGLQNGTIAITIALTILNNNELAIIPGLYSIWMLITGFGLAYFLARGHTAEAAAEAA
jgi:BASS family bile acid:Na+ symporter